MACAPSEDSDQPGHPPSLIRVFAVRMKKACVLSYQLIAQRRLRSDWANAQADLSLRWAHIPFCWLCHAFTHISPLADLDLYCLICLEDTFCRVAAQYKEIPVCIDSLLRLLTTIFCCLRSTNILTVSSRFLRV